MSVYTKSVTNSLKNIIMGVYVGFFVDFEISVSVKHQWVPPSGATHWLWRV